MEEADSYVKNSKEMASIYYTDHYSSGNKHLSLSNHSVQQLEDLKAEKLG